MLISLDLPPGWFLETLRDLRKPIIFVGDTHESTGIWQCYLQHELRGGHLTLGEGPTPQAAIDNAKAEIVKGIQQNRWHDTAEIERFAASVRL